MKMTRSKIAVFAALVALLGCSGSSKPQVKQCALNSDCSSPLVCGQGYCVGQCVTGRDCPGDQACIVLPNVGNVCQAPARKSCAYNTDCDPLFCGVDLQCRNQCLTDLDCPNGDKCAVNSSGTMLCVDPVKDQSHYDATTNRLIAAPLDGGAAGAGGGSGKGGGLAGAGGAGGRAGGGGHAGAGGAAGSAGTAGHAAGGGPDAGAVDAGLPPSCYKPGNGALHFAGGQYVTIPDAPALHPSSFTIEAWVNFSDWSAPSGPWNTIVSKPNGSGAGDSFGMGYGGGFLYGGVSVVDSSTPYLRNAWTPVAGQWYHVALTYDADSGKQKLYLDGNLVVAGDAPAAPTYDAHPIYIGADADSGSTTGLFYGDIDEVTIWPSARTMADIQADRSTCLPASHAGMVADWTFDEGTGQAVGDSSPNANAGYLGSMQVAADGADPFWTFSTVPYGGDYKLPAGGVSPSSPCGKPGNHALHMRGGQYAEAVDSPSLRLQDFTVEAWINVDYLNNACDDYHPIVYKGGAFAFYYANALQNCVVGGPRLQVDLTTGSLRAAWQPQPGRWYHVAFSYDHASANNLKLYVDGDLVQSGPAATPPTFDTSAIRLGASQSNGLYYLHGSIDEVMVWSSVRTPEQIAADRQTCAPSSLDGLAAYWPLDEGSGQTAGDATSDRNTLQLGSAVTSDGADPTWVVSTVPF
jgi:hypothetical protein